MLKVLKLEALTLGQAYGQSDEANRGAVTLLKTTWNDLMARKGSRGHPYSSRPPPAISCSGPRTCLDTGRVGHGPPGVASSSGRQVCQKAFTSGRKTTLWSNFHPSVLVLPFITPQGNPSSQTVLQIFGFCRLVLCTLIFQTEGSPCVNYPPTACRWLSLDPKQGHCILDVSD